jgi:peptidoglycan/xylan/chitin deacetylase (PgdA/CDA1 family)
MTRLLTFLFHDVYERDPDESGFAGAAADRYKLSIDAFDRQLNGLERVRTDAPVLVDQQDAFSDKRAGFAITVDDGGVSFYAHVARRLEDRGWRAHCFITTGRIGQSGFLDRQQIRELRTRGHLIGSHSVSHPTRFSNCSLKQMLREWSESRDVLRDILQEDVTVASIPGGYYSHRVAVTAAEAGFTALFTSEPDLNAHVIDGCRILGRFTVRRSSPPEFAARLGSLQSSALFYESIAWSGKKIAKRILGAAYLRLSKSSELERI